MDLKCLVLYIYFALDSKQCRQLCKCMYICQYIYLFIYIYSLCVTISCDRHSSILTYKLEYIFLYFSLLYIKYMNTSFYILAYYIWNSIFEPIQCICATFHSHYCSLRPIITNLKCRTWSATLISRNIIRAALIICTLSAEHLTLIGIYIIFDYWAFEAYRIGLPEFLDCHVHWSEPNQYFSNANGPNIHM